MGFYEGRRLLADTMLRKYGRQLALRVTSGGTHNPGTGAVSGGSPVDHAAWGAIIPSAYMERRGEVGASATRQVCLLSAEGLAVTPSSSHRLVAGAEQFEIDSVEHVAPAGVAVLYQLNLVG